MHDTTTSQAILSSQGAQDITHTRRHRALPHAPTALSLILGLLLTQQAAAQDAPTLTGKATAQTSGARTSEAKTETDGRQARVNRPADPDEALTLDTIDVRAERLRNPADQPYRSTGSSHYISAETIEQFRGSSPSDLFRGTPGVISGESRNSGGVDVNIRGLQGYGRVSVTIDGAQQVGGSYRGYFGDSNSTVIDPDLLSSVSISKGVSNDPSASGAIAGHVAMTTLTADDILQGDKTWGVRLRGGFSSNSTSPVVGTQRGLEYPNQPFDIASNIPGVQLQEPPSAYYSAPEKRPNWWEATGGNGSVAFASKQGPFEWVAALSHRERGNYFAGRDGYYARVGPDGPPVTSRWLVTQDDLNYWNEYYPGHGLRVGDEVFRTMLWYVIQGETVFRAGEEVVNTSNRMSSALLKGTMTLDGGHRFELGYLRNETKYGFSWPTFQQFAGSAGSALPQSDLSRSQSDMLTSKYRYAPDHNPLVDLTLNTWASRQKTYETVPTERDVTTTDVEAPMAGFDLSNRSRLTSALGDIALRYGLAYLTHDVDTVDIKIDADPYPYYNRTQQEIIRSQWDGFIDASWEPTTWLKLDASLRYMSAQTEQNMRPPSDPDSMKVQKISSSGFAPGMGLTVEPMDGLQFYATWKQGWRAPSPTEISRFDPYVGSRDYVRLPDGRFGFGNGPYLLEERSKSGEIGANWLQDDVLQAGDTLGLKANYFINKIDNYISNMYGEFEDGSIGSTTTNFDRAKFSGIEFSARYDSDRFFSALGAIQYDEIELCPTSAVCYIAGVDENLTNNRWRNHIPPEYTVSLTAGAYGFNRRLTLASRITRNSQSTAHVQGIRRHISDRLWNPHTLVEVFGAYQVNNMFSVDFAVENLFDVYYKDPLANISQPGPGRTFRFNMTARF